MAVVKFDGFVFDSSTYLLKRNGRHIQLRPKALQLLDLLIKNRQRVVTKDEILSSLWGSKYARDHLLFQLISELRKAPFNSNYVRTQPNLGYQWNVATDDISSAFSFPAKIAASILVGIVCCSALLLSEPQNVRPISVQLPAQIAFTKGVIAMESGQPKQAVEWFEFALGENPESSQVSLFLAQALLQQNKIEESSKRIRTLLLKPNLGDYSRMTAADLMSKILQRQGRLREALHYAEASNDVNVLAQCSVDVIEDRLEQLTGILSPPTPSTQMKPKQSSTIAVSSQRKVDGYDDKCTQLKKVREDTSYCVPIDSEVLLANSERGRHARTS